VPPHTQGETDELEGELSVTVNGEPQAAPRRCTVRQLLGTLDLDGRRVAVAVNRDVVPRSSFETHLLVDGDRIEILEAVGGG
jgi:thiamine biosynthesis protein ThiS